MFKQNTFSLAVFSLLLVTACGKKTADAGTTPPPADTAAAPTPTPSPTGTPDDRPALTDAECTAKGGSIIGDIGDGAVHQSDYRCQNGQPPLGSIRIEGNAPVAIEGSVCCPAASAA